VKSHIRLAFIVSMGFMSAPLMAWSWVEGVRNDSKYTLTIQNEEDHGGNYIEIQTSCGLFAKGDVHQCAFELSPRAQITRTDGFAIANSAHGKYLFVKAAGHAQHKLQDISYANPEYVRFDDNDALKYNEGQFILVVKDAGPQVAKPTVPYILDNDVYIYLEQK